MDFIPANSSSESLSSKSNLEKCTNSSRTNLDVFSSESTSCESVLEEVNVLNTGYSNVAFSGEDSIDTPNRTFMYSSLKNNDDESCTGLFSASDSNLTPELECRKSDNVKDSPKLHSMMASTKLDDQPESEVFGSFY